MARRCLHRPSSAGAGPGIGRRRSSRAIYVVRGCRENRARVATPRPVTIVLAGTGSRGRTFSSFAERYPEPARVVVVADSRTTRSAPFGDTLAVAADTLLADTPAMAPMSP